MGHAQRRGENAPSGQSLQRQLGVHQPHTRGIAEHHKRDRRQNDREHVQQPTPHGQVPEETRERRVEPWLTCAGGHDADEHE